MTAMTDAMKKAGVAVPEIKRVWLWLKDHPEKTAVEISKGINLDQKSVHSVLTNLKCRGMVEARKQYVRSSNKSGRSLLFVYRTIGFEYELLPKRKIGSPDQVITNKPAVQTPARTETKPKKFTINDLSVVDAKELYEELKKIFG